VAVSWAVAVAAVASAAASAWAAAWARVRWMRKASLKEALQALCAAPSLLASNR
jgi:hypothetical protein